MGNLLFWLGIGAAQIGATSPFGLIEQIFGADEQVRGWGSKATKGHVDQLLGRCFLNRSIQMHLGINARRR